MLPSRHTASQLTVPATRGGWRTTQKEVGQRLSRSSDLCKHQAEVNARPAAGRRGRGEEKESENAGQYEELTNYHPKSAESSSAEFTWYLAPCRSQQPTMLLRSERTHQSTEGSSITNITPALKQRGETAICWPSELSKWTLMFICYQSANHNFPVWFRRFIWRSVLICSATSVSFTNKINEALCRN